MVQTSVMALDAVQRRAALQQFRRRAELKVSPWEKEAKVGGGALRKFLNNQSNSMDDKTYQALASAAERLLKRPVSVSELKGERTEHESKLPSMSDIRNIDPPLQLPQGAAMTRDVPVFGTVSGEAGGLQMGSEQALDWVRRPPRFNERLGLAKDIFAAHVEEITMAPKFEPGDLIYIDPLRFPQKNDYVVVEIKEGPESPQRALLRRLVSRSMTEIRLEQFNPPDDNIIVKLMHVVNLFRVMTTHDLLGA